MRRAKPTFTWWKAMRLRQALASQAFRRSLQLCATRCLPPPANAFANCPSARSAWPSSYLVVSDGRARLQPCRNVRGISGVLATEDGISGYYETDSRPSFPLANGKIGYSGTTLVRSSDPCLLLAALS